MQKKKIGVALAMVLSVTMLIGNNTYAGQVNYVKENIQEIENYVSEHYAMNSSDKEDLVNQIYLEKYSHKSNDELRAFNSEESFADIAYEKMMDRENYIVNLISSQSKEKTTTGDWKYNLKYLLDHYDEIMALDNVNKLYIDLYIEDYEALEEAESMPEARVNEKKTTRASSYAYEDAVKYAKNYYSSYNSAYPDWTASGGDCANFISQCLYAGGKKMKGTPGTSAAAQNWANWFSKGTSCNINNVSSTWRGANAFKNYWQSNASGYSKFSKVGTSSYNYGFVGDAVSLLNSNGSAYHTLIIVGYDSTNKDFIVAAHTFNTKTAHLSDYSPSGGFIIYNMR